MHVADRPEKWTRLKSGLVCLIEDAPSMLIFCLYESQMDSGRLYTKATLKRKSNKTPADASWYRARQLSKYRSDVGNARIPGIRNSLDFLYKFPAGDLSRTNPLLSICSNRRMVCRVVERISQKHDICCLQGSESWFHIRVA